MPDCRFSWKGEADVTSLPDHSAAISRIQTDLNGGALGVSHLFPLGRFAQSLINRDLSIHALNSDWSGIGATAEPQQQQSLEKEGFDKEKTFHFQAQQHSIPT